MAKKRIKKPVRRKKESDYPGEMSFRKALSLNPVVMQGGGPADDVAYDSPEYRKAYAEGKLVSRLNSDPEDFVRAKELPEYTFDYKRRFSDLPKPQYTGFLKNQQLLDEIAQREYEQRVRAIDESVAVRKNPFSAERLAKESAATGDKLSLQMNFGDPYNSPRAYETLGLLDYFNPAVFVGDLASGLGSIPYNIQEGNYGSAVLGLAAPLAAGALAGIGVKTKRGFVNNLVNPFAGIGINATRQTPLRNAYRLNPNARTAFANVGETPHWLRGFQEEWNPTTPNQFQEMSDFLKKADDKYTELIDLSRPYSKAESNLERYWIRYQDAIRKGDKKLQEQLIKKMDREIGVQNTPLNSYFNKLGSGSYGDVYSLNSNQALKKWHTPEQLPTNVDDIIEKHKQLPSYLQSRTIIPKKGAFSKADRVEIMPKVEGAKDMKPLNQATPAEMEQVLKEIDELNKSGIYVDISNPENILINPKTGKATYLDLNTSQNIISGKRYPKELKILLNQREVPRQLPGSPNAGRGFKSEIDWRNWVKYKEDFDNNPDVIKHLQDIERKAKADGTWMKNPDGSPFQGTPEQFVVLQSDNFKKAFPNSAGQTYRGVTSINPTLANNPKYSAIFTADRNLAKTYTHNNKDNILDLYYKKSKNSADIEGLGQDWNDLRIDTPEQNLNQVNYTLKNYKSGLKNLKKNNPNHLDIPDIEKRINLLEQAKTRLSKPSNNPLDVEIPLKIKEQIPNRSIATDQIAEFVEKNKIDNINIRNINDGGVGDVRIVNHVPNNYLKSAIGNILFNMSNPNIYKSLAPIMGVGAAGTYGANQLINQEQQMKKQRGGTYNMQTGGYQAFVETLPDNLRNTDTSNYNLRGMWESFGSPKSFEDIKDTPYMPLQDDGLYHGTSVGNNGMWLKPTTHPSAWMEYMYGYALNPENNRRFDVVPNVEGYFGDNQLQYVDKKQTGGELQKAQYEEKKKSDVLDLENSLDFLVDTRGGTRDFWGRTADTIGYHESAGTMDPGQLQHGGGPGRGIFQFENDSLETAQNRYKTVANKLKLKPDPEILKAKSATELSPRQQYVLFLMNLSQSRAVLKDYAEGRLSLEDLWLQGHKNVEVPGDRKSFRTSVQKAKDKSIQKGYGSFKELGGRIKLQTGGYEAFVETLPDNLRNTDTSNYNLRGMWESFGSPNSFEDIKDTPYMPLQDDGLYHGTSVGNNGMWLKPTQHPSAWMEYMQGYALNPENNRRFDVVPNVEGYFGDNQLQYVDKKQTGGRIKFQRGGSLTTPTSASFLNRDRMRRGAVDEPSVFEDVMAGLYGVGEGLLDAATKGATDELTDMGFKALQGAAGTTGEAAQQQQGYAGVGNAVGAIGGAALGIASPEQAVTQSVKGAGKAVSGFSGSPEGDAVGQAIQQIPGLMGNFKDMKTFMASRGGRFRYQQGGQMLNQNLGLTEIGGPSHAEGGVTLPNNGQGPDIEVEGPETIYTPENYVMSEKIKASKTALREAGISEKYAGKSYADISKAIKKQGGDKLRPNDKLTLNFIDSEMKKLIKAHNIDRQLEEQKNVVAASPEEQQAGYNMYPNANSIAFPGSGLTEVIPTYNNDPIMVTGADGSQQMLVDQPIQTQAPFVEEKMARGGQMIKRADGSYSRRGLWDNIRANRGSGKKPTKQMLEQERKIKAAEKAYGGYYAEGGSFDNPGFRALPEYVQAKIKSNMEVGGYMDYDDTMEYGKGGYTVRRSNDRKGKTHVVTGPDGTKKYFGDPKLGERGKSKYGKKAFYARHKKNLAKNPYFRAYARATWEDGGYMDMLNANVDILDMDTSMYAYGGPMMYAQGGIHIDPSKRGTFKAQASKMGMGVQEAASTILNAPEGKYSPAMRKKANFARNFAKEDGGYYQMGGDMMQPQQMPQQGGGQEEAAQQIIQQVAQMLQQNVAPEQVVGKLIEMGVPQQQAIQIVEMVAQQMQGQQQPAMQQQMPQPPGIMRYGGRIKKQFGGKYFNQGIKNALRMIETTPVDTSGLDTLAAEMQPIKIPTSLNYTVEGPSLEEFKALSFEKPQKPKPTLKGLKDYKSPMGTYAAGAAGSMVGPLSNIAAAAFAPDPTYTAAPKLQRYDYTPVALQQAAGNQALANTREGFRRGAPTQGSYLSNMAVASPSMAMNLGEALAKTRYGIDTSNIGIANQEAQLAAAQAEKNALLKDQSIANRWQLGMKGAEGIGSNVQGFSKDMGAKRMQDMIVNSMKTGDFSVIGYDVVNGQLIPKLAPSGVTTYNDGTYTAPNGKRFKWNPETENFEPINK